MEKQEKIENALSKLTIEERELLGLNKKPKEKKEKKTYKLTINYMIGDADGYTNEFSTIRANNPFLKPLTDALDKLGSIEGHWGFIFDDTHLYGNLKNGNINRFEYDLLCLLSYCYEYEETQPDDEDDDSYDDSYDDTEVYEESSVKFLKKYDYEVSEKNIGYLEEFEGLFRCETSYSFLVYEGYKLK
jgi:hypothetical protein